MSYEIYIYFSDNTAEPVDADSEIIITIQVNSISNFLYIQISSILLLNSSLNQQLLPVGYSNHLQFYLKKLCIL